MPLNYRPTEKNLTQLTAHRQALTRQARGGGGGGESHMKEAGMLVVSLRGVNFGFWSHLGCSGQNAFFLAVKVSFRGAAKKYCIFLFVCVLEWSLLGVKKRLGYARLVSSRGLKISDEHPHPFHNALL